MPSAETAERFARNDIMSLTATQPRYDLAESVGPDLQLRELAAGEDIDSLALGYGTAPGDAELRRAIAALHGVDADDVVVTVGGMHALFLVAFVLCEPGDGALTTTPLFPNARAALDAVRANVTTLRLSFDSGYRLDVNAVRAGLEPNTRLVSLASPQNPSGVALPVATIAAVLDAMHAICPSARLLLDETYREAAYGDEATATSPVATDARIVSCASLSKCHGAPGLRVGWAVTRDAALREQLVLAKFNTVISLSRLDEQLALRALARSETIFGARRAHLANGLQRTAAWVEAHAGILRWVRPDAGALCCVRLEPTAFDDAGVERFYAAAEKHDVRVAPGTWFGDEARVFRLGFGLLEMPELDAGLSALSAALELALRDRTSANCSNT